MKKAAKLIVYNTLSRSLEELRTIREGEISMFVCGQTVYDDAHLGHAKNYINFDVIVGWLRHLHYKVRYVQNITDVDDKIIARALEKGEDPIKFARRFEERFLEDMEAIGVKRNVDEYPRSHDYIETIREQIQLLIGNGYGYLLDGDVYYDVAKFQDYAKLSGVRMEELEKHRIEPKQGKRNSYDFALWKASKPGEPSWKIKLTVDGKENVLEGRPGWHIEDTAMTYRIFGPQYDLHGGGSDLIFPHHTNEIAQAEAAYEKKPFVRYWMHTGLVNIDGMKMSKSLKNFLTIRELLKKHSAEALRLFVCSTHYKKEVEFSEKLMDDAEKRLRYMYAAFSIFYNMPEGENRSDEVDEIVYMLDGEFNKAMNSDFNTPVALMRFASAIDELRAFAERNQVVDSKVKEEAIGLVLGLAGVLGILQKETYKEKLPEQAGMLIKEREKLRAEKKFDESDQIRKKLKDEYKIIVEDSEYGPIWYRE